MVTLELNGVDFQQSGETRTFDHTNTRSLHFAVAGAPAPVGMTGAMLFGGFGMTGAMLFRGFGMTGPIVV
jgi:hypothetical protein